MRTFAPGMARAIGKDNWYGEVAPQLLGEDEYGLETLPEPLSHRSTASARLSFGGRREPLHLGPAGGGALGPRRACTLLRRRSGGRRRAA